MEYGYLHNCLSILAALAFIVGVVYLLDGRK